MKLDENSYYLRCFAASNGVESAFLVYYKEVWHNGFVSDSYTIDKFDLGYEDASWNGLNIEKLTLGTRILKRNYNRWAKYISDSKTRIEQISKASAKPFDKECQVGDYIYIDYKGLLAEDEANEAEQYPEEYLEDENHYDGPDLSLFHLGSKNVDIFNCSEIIIDKYNARIKDSEKFAPLDYSDNKHWLFYIPKEVYEESQKIIRDTFMKLMSEMKQTVHKIEMR